MSDLLQQQKVAIANWSAQAIEQAWLTHQDESVVAELSLAAPDGLFDQTERPLIAGLFGGTGVGKSSLLNRLAGEPVARTSAERPTSRDITVYVHRSISVDRLPAGFPMDRIRTSLHNNQRYQQVMFIDMPDFDSVDTSNRDLVDLWLPHLDVVLYVVSPERYRDDQGWRLLLEHAHEHGWIFVFNHWDRGAAEQFSDFQQQLKAAGLSNPVMFKTDCSTAPEEALNNQARPDDEFDALQQRLIDLSEANIVQALQEHGVLARLNALKEAADSCLAKVATDAHCEQLQTQWAEHSTNTREPGKETLQWPFTQVARQYEQPARRWWQIRASENASKPAATGSAAESTSDIAELLQDQFDRALNNFINQQAHTLQIPVGALKHALTTDYATARKSVPSCLADQLNLSLAQPGNRWQRLLYRGTSVLCVLLPVAAMAWIAWRVVNGFIDGAADPSAYLGSSFAINSALLVALAWLVPAFTRPHVRPSSATAALRGLNKGYEQAYDSMDNAVTRGLAALKSNAVSLRQNYASIWTELPQSDNHQLPDGLRQLIVKQISPDSPQLLARGLDVRANTHSSTDSAPVS